MGYWPVRRVILWLRGQPIAQRLIDPRLPAVAELDELKDIVKRHWLFILGRPNGQRAILTGRDLRNLDFGGLNLQSVVAPRADFTNSSFAGTDLSFADLFGANLELADCTGADLHKADLRGVRLHGAKLISANLETAGRPGHAASQSAQGMNCEKMCRWTQ